MLSHESFHVHLYGPGRRSDDSAARETAPIPTSFEEAERRLIEFLPTVLLEPDGSFAWAGPDHQVVGMIYDAAMSIQYLELRGHCDRDRLRKLVQTLSGTAEIDDFDTMVLPKRQWKTFQSFERSLPESTH